MFCSSSSFNPIQYPNHTMLATTSTDTQNPGTIHQDDHSPPFFYFPEPFLDEADLLVSEFLSSQTQQQQQQQVSGSNISSAVQEITEPAIATRISNKKKKSNFNKAVKQPNPRRRTGKKDRHSKIHTAQGPRDRRMRLSLQIARKFFDLQDMLGFDKASNTIEWLFTKSKAAIKELTDSLPRVKKSISTGGKNAVSSTSESEVVSGKKPKPLPELLVNTSRGKKSNRKHKLVFTPFARESRDKARERARERTREKKKILDLDKLKLSSSSSSSPANPNNLKEPNNKGNCCLENGENLISAGSFEKNSVRMVSEEEETSTHLLRPQQLLGSASVIDKYFGITNASRSSSIFNFSPINFEDEPSSGFPVNWDMINNTRLLQLRYSAMPMPDMKLSTTGNVHLQNRNSILMSSTGPNVQDTIFMTSLINPQEENPSSVFMNISSSNDQQNPPHFNSHEHLY